MQTNLYRQDSSVGTFLSLIGWERYADGYYRRTMNERLADNRLSNTILHITGYDDFGLMLNEAGLLAIRLHSFMKQAGNRSDSILKLLPEYTC